jgi:hypothetical protein
MPDDIFSSAGFRVPELAAGLSGGVVKALFAKESIGSVLTSALGGALTANYLSGTFSHLWGKILSDPLDPGVSGFLVGLTAMTLCQALIARIGRTAKRWTNGANDV